MEHLIRKLDRTRYPQVTAGRKALELALLVLKAAKDEAGIDGLTAPEITRVLVEKFRVSEKESAIRMALGRARRLVNDVPRGRGRAYCIMAEGEQLVSKLT